MFHWSAAIVDDCTGALYGRVWFDNLGNQWRYLHICYHKEGADSDIMEVTSFSYDNLLSSRSPDFKPLIGFPSRISSVVEIYKGLQDRV